MGIYFQQLNRSRMVLTGFVTGVKPILEMDGNLLESSENWYVIHREVFEHESNLGYHPETFNDGVLEN